MFPAGQHSGGTILHFEIVALAASYQVAPSDEVWTVMVAVVGGPSTVALALRARRRTVAVAVFVASEIPDPTGRVVSASSDIDAIIE